MTDAPVEDNFTISTELPAQDAQEVEALQTQADLHEFRFHPAWPIIEAKLQGHIDRYKSPAFPVGMSYEEVGREYTISRAISQILEEVLHDVRG